MHEIERVWKILELDGTENMTGVKKKYKNLVRKYHPDRYQNPEDKKRAEKRLKEIIETYRYMMNNIDKFICRNGEECTQTVEDEIFRNLSKEEKEALFKMVQGLSETLEKHYADNEESFDDTEEIDEREFFRKYYPEIDDKEFFEHYASSEYREKYAKQYSYEVKEPQQYTYSEKPQKEYAINKEQIFSDEKITYYWERIKNFYNIAVVVISLVIIVLSLFI